MRYLQFILLNLLTMQLCLGQEISQDGFVPIENLEAFTHPQFFYSDNCKWSNFNTNYLFLTLYNIPSHSSAPYSEANMNIIPANFDVGNAVKIIGKQDAFFKIIIQEGAPCDNNEDLVGREFWVKKGTLGTWIGNFNTENGEYEDTPLYKDKTTNSKIIFKLKPKDSVVIILDVQDN